jgi:hypothetical protein
MSEHKLSPSKRLMFSFMLAGASLILLELLASSAILYRLRASNTENVSRSEVSDISLINILHEAGVRVGLFAELEPFEYRRETQPAPFLRPDAQLGYAGRPGTYLNTFSRMRNRTTRSQWEHARFKVTINEDGRRWTGHSADDNKPSVYVLGDSWVFGTGVNDEQTFCLSGGGFVGGHPAESENERYANRETALILPIVLGGLLNYYERAA